MGFIYGLAVVLIIFEGIIIQCEGGCAFSSNQGQNAIPTDDINDELEHLPDDVIGQIVKKLNFEKIYQYMRFPKKPITRVIMSRIFQDYIIEIDERGRPDDPDIEKYRVQGDSFITIKNYRKFEVFFNEYADQVKKIQISYSSLSCEVPHKEINQNFIKQCAGHLEELRFGYQGDIGFWEEISEGKNYFTFPEVTTFQTKGCTQKKFDLNLIFPKLKSLKLSGTVADGNCLANLKELEEFTLCTNSIKEHKLDKLFANNLNLRMIHLYSPNRTETMRSIAKYSTKLETLSIESPGEAIANGDFSFDMPNLKKLILTAFQPIDRILNFINYFKKLEKVKFGSSDNFAIERIGYLQHLREIETTISEFNAESLKRMFRSFDKKCKLQTLKFKYFPRSNSMGAYEAEMEKIDIYLQNSMERTWTLSRGKQIETYDRTFMFTRKPSKK